MDELKKYQQRMTEFCSINDINLADRLKKVPEEKHFWNTQLIDNKIKLLNLERKKKKMAKEVSKQILEESEVRLTKSMTEKLIDSSLEKINEEIEDLKLLIEWLELNTKTVSFTAQDFKNIIELKKIEEI